MYVVSGYRRSGTTAMMRALHQGGLPMIAEKELQSDWDQAPQDGYQPLPDGGLYEVGRHTYLDPGVMRALTAKTPANVCIKVFFDGLPTLPVHNYRVIFMRRDPAEIAASMEKVNEYKRKRQFPVKEHKRLPFDAMAPFIPEDVEQCLAIARARRDMDVIEVDFRDLVENPERELYRLGAPIDIQKASKAIDPAWYRERVA
jgi:hypothetical protein